jgi:hypothetical protein
MSHDGCDGRLGWYVDDIKVGYCGNSALPVSFLHFTARSAKTHINLAWETAHEAQNEGFHVERRATNASVFQELGYVAAARSNDYTFKDHSAQPGVNYYYRLRQVDLDGTEAYSELVSAGLEATGLQVYPNPVSGRLSIRTDHQEGKAILYNAAGKKVLETKLNEGAGSLMTGNLPSGIYLLRLAESVVRVVVK